MPVRGNYIKNGIFCGEACKVNISNFVPSEIQFIITIGWNQCNLTIKDPEKTLLPQLKEMYPEWFTNNDKECHV